MVDNFSSADTQPVAAKRFSPNDQIQSEEVVKPRRRLAGCCSSVLLFAILVCLLVSVLFFLPTRTNILLIGIDRTPPGTAVGRSDTIILVTVQPLKSYVGMLSIPRDLWVSIPGVGENRINAAYFLAENEQQGMGPSAAMRTLETNFGVDVPYYVRIQFDGIQDIVELLGGVPIELDQATAILPAGNHVLDGATALAFVRDRAGSDDFFRMERGQMLIRAVFRRFLAPEIWPRLPVIWVSMIKNFDTNIPPWVWPSLGLTLLRVGPEGVDARVVGRDMVQGFTTQSGAQVLAPDWSKINPVLLEMFGQ
ncbi:MAG TPA: LCP family protein [Anaerolineae bacterium]|nr:LCP family protein [Anaerolineae bacterium]